MADNVTGAISPQDLRDCFVTLHGCWGCLGRSADAALASFSCNNTTWQTVRQFTHAENTSSPPTYGVSSKAAGGYSVLKPLTSGYYHLNANLLFSASGALTLYGMMWESTTSVPSTKVLNRIPTAIKSTANLAFHGIEQLKANKEYRLKVQAGAGSTNMALVAGHFSIYKVG